MELHQSPETKSKNQLEQDDLDEELAIKATQTGHTANHDVVFGEISEHGPNYRNVHKSYLIPRYKLTKSCCRSDSSVQSFS